MKISDETLMSFADDELDAGTRADVEAAMHDDPGIAQRIEEHRALRAKLQKAFARELEEVPPERLVAAARGDSVGRADATVVSLEASRSVAARARSKTAKRTAWRPAVSIAASVLLGIGLGAFVFHRSSPVISKRSGGLVASGALAKALSDDLGNAVDSSGTERSGTARLGLSFLAKSGDYCRTFTLAAAAGLACRRDGDWHIEAWTESSESVAASSASQNYRTASTPLPPELVSAVEERIAGDPLDQAAEAAALHRGWEALHGPE